MIISSATLNALRTTFNAQFNQALKNVAPSFQKIATIVPSSSKSNTYGWLGASSEFREWVGERVFNDLSEHAYTITNKTFENSVQVKRDDIEDDNLGVYTPMVQNLAQKGGMFPDKLVYQLLAAGFTTACYDGQNFFDAEHPVNDKHDGTGTDELVSNVIIDGTYTGEPWFLLDTSQVLKPLIFQERRKLALTTKFNPNDESVFNANTFKFGADLRCNAGFGFWQMAIGVKKALSLDTLWDAWEQMEAMKHDGGEPMELSPTLLVVGPSNRKLAMQLMNRETIDDGGTAVSNELKGMFEVLVAPRLK
ncbi:Mu-like prophage major head subunit gpT family protein [Agarivorans gilvus]|uniref:Head protein n=1 Tax=Agarivorans gilvus TaxID=680279 RepID=A0ABQ1HX43_9ALTE|nr:Mu-like prophage major head subunit gpT family protein [Agarivorans gilvus]GGA95798.1 head protein [Agarivorans gilvus]